jgi:hypothetical protein
MSATYTSKDPKYKLTICDDGIKDLNAATFKGGWRLPRLMWAHIRCSSYLLWASLLKREAMFIGYNKGNKQSLVGTCTGTLSSEEGLMIHRVFWCQK